jgi:hypothetical protein
VTLDLAGADAFSVACQSLPPTDPQALREFSPAAMTPGGSMRLLLTSAGIKNASIHAALVDLLGKPIAESSAFCIPEMKQQIDTSGEQDHPARRTLERDQTQDKTRARRIASSHRQS